MNSFHQVSAQFCILIIFQNQFHSIKQKIAKGLQEEMLGTGPICRYASDLKLLVKIFSGPRFEEGKF
jgi:hypothetical protein